MPDLCIVIQKQMSNNLKIGDTAMKNLMIMAMMMVMTISAKAMSYNAAKHEALILSDKMAYELNLTNAQYDENKNHFYKSNPKGYSSYKGGNNKKSDRFYADRNTNKSNGKRGNDRKANGNGSVSRSSSNNHRALAQNNNGSRGNGTVRSGRR